MFILCSPLCQRERAIKISKCDKKRDPKIADDSFKEITLLGQNIDAFGRDLPGTTKEGRKENTLTDLLYYIHDV